MTRLDSANASSKGPKQCRRRWGNHLNANNKTESWSPEEDATLLEGHARLGNRWTELARLVGGRTDNAVKNRFDALARKRKRAEAQGAAAGGADAGGGKASALEASGKANNTPPPSAAGAAEGGAARKKASAEQSSPEKRKRKGGLAAAKPASTLPPLMASRQKSLSIQIPSAPHAPPSTVVTNASGVPVVAGSPVPPTLAMYLRTQLAQLSPMDLRSMGGMGSPDLAQLFSLFGAGDLDHLPSADRRAQHVAGETVACGGRGGTQAPSAAAAAAASDPADPAQMLPAQTPAIDPEEVMGWLRAITPRAQSTGRCSGPESGGSKRGASSTPTTAAATAGGEGGGRRRGEGAGGSASGACLGLGAAGASSSVQGSALTPASNALRAGAQGAGASDAPASTSPAKLMPPPSATDARKDGGSCTGGPTAHASHRVLHAHGASATPPAIPTPTSGAEMLMRLAEQPGGLAVVQKLLLLCNSTPTAASMLNMHHTGHTPPGGMGEGANGSARAPSDAKAAGCGGGVDVGTHDAPTSAAADAAVFGNVLGWSDFGPTSVGGTAARDALGAGAGLGLTPRAAAAAASGAAAGAGGAPNPGSMTRRSPRLRSVASLTRSDAAAAAPVASSPAFSAHEAHMLLNALGADTEGLLQLAAQPVGEPTLAADAPMAPGALDSEDSEQQAHPVSSVSFEFHAPTTPISASVFSPRRSPRTAP